MAGYPYDFNQDTFPGMSTATESVQNQVWWEGPWHNWRLPAVIVGTARDAGNTVTNTLRAGLLLGRVSTTGFLKEWNPTGTDGSEIIVGVLEKAMQMLLNGSSTDRYTGNVLFGGGLYSDRILVPGSATEGIVGNAREYQILAMLQPRFWLDRHIGMVARYTPTASFRFLTAAENTAHAVTVVEAENGKTFLMTGATAADVTFTLPAAETGESFSVVANVASLNAIIALASGTIVIPGNVAATTITLAPGESCTFVAIAAGVYALTNYTQVDAT